MKPTTRSFAALGALFIAGCGGPGAEKVDPLESIRTALAAPDAHTPFTPKAPAGIPQELVKVPADNPVTKAKVELGRQLYFDKRLSRDKTVSCATCHAPSKGWGDGEPVSTGINGQKGGRSAPTVMNRVLTHAQFWDGRAASLEEQAVGPIGNPIEMGFTVEEAAALLNKIPGYKMQFEAVFKGPATPDRIGKAIAAFERTVFSGGAPYDYYEAAKFYLENPEPFEDDGPEELAERKKALEDYAKHPMSEAAIRGREIYFGKAKCATCHIGANFADEQYHNLGVGMEAARIAKGDFDKGREDHTGKIEDRGAFKTPTLRNIADTAPYMHDGSQKTLEEVVRFYMKGGHANPWLSPKVEKLELTDLEVRDLVEFMEKGLQGTVTPVREDGLPPDAAAE